MQNDIINYNNGVGDWFRDKISNITTNISERREQVKSEGIIRTNIDIKLDALFGQDRKTLSDMLANAKRKRDKNFPLTDEEKLLLANENQVMAGTDTGATETKDKNVYVWVGVGLGILLVGGIITYIVFKK